VHFYEQINDDNNDDTFTQWQTLNVHDVSYNRSTLVLAAIILLCSPVHVLYFVTFCDFLLLDIHCLIILTD